MQLTEIEQKICDKYSAYRPVTKYDKDGNPFTVNRVACNECPLVMDSSALLCRANATEEDLKEYL